MKKIMIVSVALCMGALAYAGEATKEVAFTSAQLQELQAIQDLRMRLTLLTMKDLPKEALELISRIHTINWICADETSKTLKKALDPLDGKYKLQHKMQAAKKRTAHTATRKQAIDDKSEKEKKRIAYTMADITLELLRNKNNHG